MVDFDLFKVKVIDRYFSFLEKGLTRHQTPSIDIIARQNRFSRFGCTLIKERKKLKKKEKEKKGTNLVTMSGMCTSVRENFSETKFC